MQDKKTNAIVVYQANPLIERKNNMSVPETKLFLYCLTRLNPQLPNSKYYDETFMRTNIPTKDIIELFGGNAWYYEELKKVALQMASRAVIIEHEHGFKAFSLFAEIDFDSKKGLTFEFHKNMYPFLLELSNRPYTRLDFEQLWKLTSIYAIRILELLLQYRKIRMRTVTIEELRAWLGISKDAYKGRIDNFKKFVIELPVKEINEKTMFTVVYEFKKTGRQVTSVCFVLIEPPKPERTEPTTEEEAIKKMSALGIDKGMINHLLKEFGARRCLDNIVYVVENYRKKAKNLAGYVVEAIKNDFWAAHRQQMDKELIAAFPTDTPQQIKDLEFAAAQGNPLAVRRLELLHEQKRKHDRKAKSVEPEN